MSLSGDSGGTNARKRLRWPPLLFPMRRVRPPIRSTLPRFLRRVRCVHADALVGLPCVVPCNDLGKYGKHLWLDFALSTC